MKKLFPTPRAFMSKEAKRQKPTRKLGQNLEDHMMFNLEEEVKTQSSQLPLLLADSLASLLVLPGSERAKEMTVTSGRKCLELLKSSGPLGLLAKMLLESSIWVSNKRFLTWKVRDTKFKRLIFQLVPSMPPTKELDYGLLPTITASDATTGQIIGKDDTFYRTKNGTLRKINRKNVSANSTRACPFSFCRSLNNSDFIGLILPQNLSSRHKRKISGAISRSRKQTGTYCCR